MIALIACHKEEQKTVVVPQILDRIKTKEIGFERRGYSGCVTARDAVKTTGREKMKSKIIALIGLVLVIASFGLANAAAPSGTPTYLAVGDSLAYGMQIGHLRQEMKSGTVNAASFDTGYVNRLAAMLKRSTPNLRVVDLGCPGETTTSFISGPCAFATNGKPFGNKPLPMHVKYQGAQLLAALKYLENPNDNVRLITVDIGINDLRADELACGSKSGSEACLQSKWC